MMEQGVVPDLAAEVLVDVAADVAADVAGKTELEARVEIWQPEGLEAQVEIRQLKELEVFNTLRLSVEVLVKLAGGTELI